MCNAIFSKLIELCIPHHNPILEQIQNNITMLSAISEYLASLPAVVFLREIMIFTSRMQREKTIIV